MFDFETIKGKRVILFGAGNEGVCAAGILRENGIEPVCFCDNYKQGIEPRTGLKIISAAELDSDYADAIILVTAITYAEEIIAGLKASGISEERIVTALKSHHYQQPHLAYFEINIVDHCNITCKGCSHFSPIAEKRFSPLEVIQSDLRRMSELTLGKVDEFHILGGEPLLHPDLLKILVTARECFPDTVISLISNGVLLLKQEQEFWDVCYENRITIEVTKYPMKIDYDKIIQTVKEKKIAFKFHSYTGQATKTMYKMPLDLEGTQDETVSFRNCTLANRWIALMDGRMYTCQVAPNIMHFNKKFAKNLALEAGDSIDIYQAKDIDEILAFLSTPKPFCKYCKATEVVSGIPWGPSKGELSEWV